MEGHGERVRQPRLAALVAAQLRSDILSGRLRESDVIPKQEVLLREFGVSPAVGREALRILETEGLVSVRRGNRGGAVVHLPKADDVGYMASLVLQLEGADLSDLGTAMLELESIAAGLCASQRDRRKRIVPRLRDCLDRQAEARGNQGATIDAAARFHQTLVELCGNEALILVLDAMRAIWERQDQSTVAFAFEWTSPDAASAQHEALIDAVAAGDEDRAAAIAHEHGGNLSRAVADIAHDPILADNVRPNR